MAGNARFELSSASPEPGFSGNYPNGQRGNYSGPNFDRSGSFREGVDSRMFGFGVGTARMAGTLMGDLPPLSQCLILDPIIMADQKYPRSGELRRVLGFSFGSIPEDNSFGAAHVKPSPPIAMEDLKRFRASISDTCNKARGRAKKLDEHLHKLNNYFEAVNSMKQHRNELLMNERSGGSNLKMGNQIHRNPPDLTHKLDDRPKNLILNKRVRTSMAETRAECRSSGQLRQPMVMAKDRDMPKESCMDPDLAEEKNQRLPAGGEGWDKKMKRKRSVGAVFTRSIDSDGELKRAMHHKLGSEPGLQSGDTRGFRSGASNGTGGISKFDGTSSPASSGARTTPKNEQEKAVLPRDLAVGLNKERFLSKGSNKLNNRENSHVGCPTLVTKGKASRALRTSALAATNTSANIPRVSGTIESWEQPMSVNKISSVGGANNRKRAMPAGSSSPPMAQWVGQRTQKMSRTRRANLVSPVSTHDDMQISSEGCSPSDFGAQLTSNGANSSLVSRAAAIGTQKFKVKLENASSPARLSESEESGAGERRSREKGISGGEVEEKKVTVVQNAVSSSMLTKKNKLLIKEEIGDGLRKQGRSGRGSSFSRASISPAREKAENGPTTKPIRSTRPGSDKNGSKSGRSLKKLSDRKGFSRLGHMLNSGSPDFTGESDDDREELLAAAKLASDTNYRACSSSFWKKAEPFFAPVSLDDTSYLSQQLKFAEELHESLSQMFDRCNNMLGDSLCEENLSDTVLGGKNRNVLNQVGSKESTNALELGNQLHDAVTLFGRLDSERKFDKVTPLYQIVLSALIVEDEVEAFEENGVEGDLSYQNAISYDACILTDAECRIRSGMESECGAMLGIQIEHHGTTNGFFTCNSSTIVSRSSGIQNHLCNGKLPQIYSGYMNSDAEVLAELSGNDLDGPKNVQTKGLGISSCDFQYEKMCLDDKLLLELQSVGLYPERVPDLDDREDETISQEILQLRRDLYQQVCKKKMYFDKLSKAVEVGRDVEGRNPEQVAIDRLVEVTYKKQLATRGSSASKFGVAKVPKQVALAFSRRTLARCRKFEQSGTSCFGEPALRDIIFARPPWGSEVEPLTGVGLAVTNSKRVESCNPQAVPRASGSFFSNGEGGSLDVCVTLNHQSDQVFVKNGPISIRGKKKEVLLDDFVGGAAFRGTSTLRGSLTGGAKGKRSDRERDKDSSSRNAVTKAGHTSAGNFKGDRKTKTKPKQKATQLSTSGNGFVTNFTESKEDNSGNGKRNDPRDLSREEKDPMDFTSMQLPGFDSIEELGGNPDFSSWFNFDEDSLQDGLQEHDIVGLDIPMDDLSELNMF